MLTNKIHQALPILAPSIFAGSKAFQSATSRATESGEKDAFCTRSALPKDHQVDTISSGRSLTLDRNPEISTLSRLTHSFANQLVGAKASCATSRSQRIHFGLIPSFSTDAHGSLQHQAQYFALTADEQQQLENQYGRDAVHDCLENDVFDNVETLRRHLAYIQNTATISLRDYAAIKPFECLSNFSPKLYMSSLEYEGLQPDQFCRIRQAISKTPDTKITSSVCDNNGNFSFSVQTSFGLPNGWKAEDTFTQPQTGFYRVGTTLRSPDGGSGRVERSFDGRRLSLEEAYNCTLPTSLEGIPGINRRISTMNFMTARACKILGVTKENLSEIRISRLQHRPTLAHLDWMQRKHPNQKFEALFDHTTWAKTHIKNTARIIGHEILPLPTINLQGGEAWLKPMHHSKVRKWDFFQAYTERCTVMYLTGQTLPKVDDVTKNWREEAKLAIENYKAKCSAGLIGDAADAVTQNIDKLLAKKFAAIAAEEIAVRQRYNLPGDSVPQNINFDVIYKTRKLCQKQATKNMIILK